MVQRWKRNSWIWIRILTWSHWPFAALEAWNSFLNGSSTSTHTWGNCMKIYGDFTEIIGNYEPLCLLCVSVNLLHTIFPQCINVNNAKKYRRGIPITHPPDARLISVWEGKTEVMSTVICRCMSRDGQKIMVRKKNRRKNRYI